MHQPTTPNKSAHIHLEEMPFQASHQRSGINTGSGRVGEHGITSSVSKFSLNLKANALFTGLKARRYHSISTHVRSTILRFFQCIISSSFERHTVLFCEIFTPTLNPCLLPPPDSEAPSMTLCAQFLSLGSEAIPYVGAGTNCLFPSSDLSSLYVQYDRTTKKKLAKNVSSPCGNLCFACNCAVAPGSLGT